MTFREDPNWKKNRIPFPKELYTLRGLIYQNSRMSYNLSHELGAAIAVMDEALLREQTLLLELESVRSEIKASETLVNILRYQQQTLWAEQRRLSGLVHPIRRYPADVLRVIFEWAVLGGTTQMCKTAFNLSQVCRQWRSIAHDTPVIWNHISIPETNSTSNIPALWKHLVSKIRLVPPKFTFKIWSYPAQYEDDEVEDEHEALNIITQNINFNDCNRIGLLRFETPAKLTSHLINCDIDCQVVIDRIEVSIEGASRHIPSWDLVAFLRQFEAVVSLRVTGASQVIAGETTKLDTLTTLELIEVGSTALVAKLAQFRNLRTLELSSVDFTKETLTQDVILEALEILKIDTFESVPWQRIQTPRLANLLAVGEKPVHNDILSFLKRNRTVRHVLASICEDQFKTFALAAPNLESLEISSYFQGLYDWETIDLNAPPFPRLHTLVIIGYETLNLDHFDKLLTSRCHACPTFSKANGLVKSLDRISTRSRKVDTTGQSWGLLPSLAQCSVAYRYPPDMWGPEWVDCVFSWV